MTYCGHGDRSGLDAHWTLPVMTHSSDASSRADRFFQSADNDLQPPSGASLRAGLAALKQQDYATAIAQLEAVCQSALDEATHLKAQMGLIKAYEQTGDLKLAIALCTPLCSHSSERVKTWGKHTLSHLQAQRTPAATSAMTDPESEPSQPSAPIAAPASGDYPAPAAETGFVPLDPAATEQRPRPQLTQLQSPATYLQDPSAEASKDSASGAAALPSDRPTHAAEAGDTIDDDDMDDDDDIDDEALLSSPPPPESAVDAPMPFGWRAAGRAGKWNPILAEKGKGFEYWAVQALTAIALFLVIRGLAAFIVLIVHSARNVVIRILYNQQYGYPNVSFLWWIVPLLLITLAISPWVMALLLRWGYGAQKLTSDTLEQYSPESLRLIKRLCTRDRRARPKLVWLPTAAPVALSYGFIARNARIVLSQGLLEQLEDSEIASIVASEMAHLRQRTSPLMTLIATITHVHYMLYWQLAQQCDRIDIPVVNWLLAIPSMVNYGLFWLFRYPGFWFSRYRVWLSDRHAVNEIGNPNALARALIKINQGIVREILHHGRTDPLLEGLELLMPVSYRSALLLGSAPTLAALEDLLALELQNPHRRWLTLNHSHPPLGDRLFLLTRYAQRWHLDSECHLPNAVKPTLNLRQLLHQAAPFLGLPIGMGLALCLWGIGLVALGFRFAPLEWLWGDRSLLNGFALICCSIGIMIRVNQMFPDISRKTSRVDVALPTLFADAALLPVVGQPVQLHGRLIGRRGFSNAFEQDLMLHTSSGLIKLHYLSPLGAIGNLIPQPGYPRRAISRTVTLTGWFRRGATPWIDVDRIQPQGLSGLRSGHPVWSTLLAIAIALLGILIILRGAG